MAGRGWDWNFKEWGGNFRQDQKKNDGTLLQVFPTTYLWNAYLLSFGLIFEISNFNQWKIHLNLNFQPLIAPLNFKITTPNL